MDNKVIEAVFRRGVINSSDIVTEVSPDFFSKFFQFTLTYGDDYFAPENKNKSMLDNDTIIDCI